jgi:hypothetical protein
MSEILCPGIVDRGTEFVVAYDPITQTTTRRFGTCGPRALASVLSNALGTHILCADVYTSMRGASPTPLCDPTGATTIGDLQVEASRYTGAVIAAVQPYGEPWSGWASFFQAHAGVDPFLFETANGQALVDLISGLGENATNLQYHFLAVLGRNTGGWSPLAQRTLPPGYWCADGDNFAGGNNVGTGFNAANVLQFYPDTVVAAARPCGAIALKGAKATMAWQQQPDGTGKDDQGHVCGQGDMTYLIAHGLAASDGLMGEQFYTATDSFLPLANGRIVTAHRVGGQWTVDEQGAQALVAVWEQLEAEAEAKPATLTPYQLAAIAAAEAQMSAQSALASAQALKGK